MKTLLAGISIGAVLIVGCGAQPDVVPHRSVQGAGSSAPQSHQTVPAAPCSAPAPLGCSLPKQSRTRTVPAGSSRVFPDVSEYQGCPSFTGPLIFKVYEGGYGQDHSALCNARRVHALHLWAGVYAFLRPANCAGQGWATSQIVKQIGGVPGPVVADAEVSLPRGCVASFLHQVQTQLGGPVDVYTSPGTWPGGFLTAPLWVATYGPRPGCVEGVCSHVAWQFTDNGRCGGLSGTDCSISTGILSQSRQPAPHPQPKPPKPRPRAQQIAYLRSLARKHHCYQPAVQHRYHACKVWGHEVQVLLHGRGQ
jgi:hypothetical protein